MKQTHWHVLGAGAIGCLYADALDRGGFQTSLILRHATDQKSVALIVEREGTKEQRYLNIANHQDLEPISHLLVATKAFDVYTAVSGIAHRLDENSVVVLLINGMGLAEQLNATYPHLNLYCATTTHGAYRIAPQHICHAGLGETRIGRQGLEQPPDWYGLWEDAIENSHWDANINTALWSKLAVNCIVNPLTALHHCPNGELATDRSLSDKVAHLCDEVSHICREAGHADIADPLPQSVASVIRQTATNRSSMLQDVEHGRPTEIDYINGFLLQVARQYGIAAPLNNALIQRVKNHAA